MSFFIKYLYVFSRKVHIFHFIFISFIHLCTEWVQMAEIGLCNILFHSFETLGCRFIFFKTTPQFSETHSLLKEDLWLDGERKEAKGFKLSIKYNFRIHFLSYIHTYFLPLTKFAICEILALYYVQFSQKLSRYK